MKLNKIKVIVAGFRGKMGATAVQMILNAQNFELMALLGKKEEVSEAFGVPVFSRKEDLIGFDAKCLIRPRRFGANTSKDDRQKNSNVKQFKGRVQKDKPQKKKTIRNVHKKK